MHTRVWFIVSMTCEQKKIAINSKSVLDQQIEYTRIEDSIHNFHRKQGDTKSRNIIGFYT